MRRSQDCWDIVPVRLVLGSLAAAGSYAVIGLYFPRFNALAIVLYGTVKRIRRQDGLSEILDGTRCSVQSYGNSRQQRVDPRMPAVGS